MAGTSYQMLQVLASGERVTSFTKDNVTLLTFLVKNVKMKLSGSLYFEKTRRTSSQISYS